jgi:hypothetical protein
MAKSNPKTKPAAENKVIYDALVVRQFTDGKGEERNRWHNVGVAFPHEDGDGFNVTLDALPVDGKLVLRLRKAKEE